MDTDRALSLKWIHCSTGISYDPIMWLECLWPKESLLHDAVKLYCPFSNQNTRAFFFFFLQYKLDGNFHWVLWPSLHITWNLQTCFWIIRETSLIDATSCIFFKEGTVSWKQYSFDSFHNWNTIWKETIGICYSKREYHKNETSLFSYEYYCRLGRKNNNNNRSCLFESTYTELFSCMIE